MSKLIFCEIGESFPLISTENFIELIGKIYNKINPNEFCIIDSNLNLYKNIPNEREINSNDVKMPRHMFFSDSCLSYSLLPGTTLMGVTKSIRINQIMLISHQHYPFTAVDTCNMEFA